ncbi:MAG: GNAT family N-acetyltransferase [Desulfobacterales bacterium]|nr:GNAT family N-acetyltransferase [Desulfobacterales bacterium]
MIPISSIGIGLSISEAGSPSAADPIHFEYEPLSEDRQNVRRLVEATGFFYPDEVDVAEELVEERLEKGDKSGYFFVLVRRCGRLIGYGAYGPIPCTVSSYDLYWIAVDPDFQGHGLGRRILDEIERLIRLSGGTRVYVETSSRPRYASTRKFYQSCGYRIESTLENFYAKGDGKVTFGKVL